MVHDLLIQDFGSNCIDIVPAIPSAVYFTKEFLIIRLPETKFTFYQKRDTKIIPLNFLNQIRNLKILNYEKNLIALELKNDIILYDLQNEIILSKIKKPGNFCHNY